MASTEYTTEFKDALITMKNSLRDKKYDDKFDEVKDFLRHIDQANAEKSCELVLNRCNEFLKEEKVTRIQGASLSEIEDIKKKVSHFLNQVKRTSTQSTSKGGNSGFSQTLPPGKSDGKLNIPVQSASGHHKTVVNTGKTGQQERPQGSSPKVMKKEPSGYNEKANNVMAEGVTEKESLEKRDQELEEKMKILIDTIQQKDRELRDRQNSAEILEHNGNKLYQENQNLSQEIERLKESYESLLKDNNRLKQREQDLQSEVQEKTEQWNEAILQYEEKSKAVEHFKKKVSHLEDTIKSKDRQNEERIQKLSAERDDLRNRYSKVAGQKLKDNNSDISDLSDPNRPMKLGEKFSELYDNEWTDAFSNLTDKKSEKDAIKYLLDTLQDCYSFCKDIAERQMTELRNIFLYNCQDMNKPVTKDKPRLHSDQEKALLEVRKTIASTKSEPVKQQFLEKMRTKPDEKLSKEITAYYEKCTEICWLLAINNPPLYMDTEFKQGTKLDLNLYTPYYTPGDKTDFLVWPPLFNVKNGGLINKGVMAPVQEKKKIKK